MTSSRLQSLTIYLIETDYDDLEEVLKDPYAYDNYEVTTDDRRIGVLFVEPVEETTPDWAELFDEALDIEELSLASQSPRALLLAEAADLTFAIAFGLGRYMLKSGVTSTRFGLRVTLNAVPQDSIKAIDRDVFQDIPRKASEQLFADESDIGAFGLDVERDLVRSVTGSPEDSDLAHQLTGRDSLKVKAYHTLANIHSRLGRLRELYEADDYREKFPWIENISEIKDKDLESVLYGEVLRRVSEGELDGINLGVPEVIDWGNVIGFKYRRVDDAPILPEVSFDNYFSDVRSPNEIRFNHLESDVIRAVDSNGEKVEAWILKRCIGAEIQVNGEQFVHNDGTWYKVDAEFVSRVDETIDGIDEIDIDLPAYNGGLESEYNERVAEELGDSMALMDGMDIRRPTGESAIEFCDLFEDEGRLVHVKKHKGSSVLSHWIAQGTVSADLFQSDRRFREALNEQLPRGHKLAEPGARIDTSEYEVAYAVISKESGYNDLPFFTRVNLKNAVQRLRSFGYSVAYSTIDNNVRETG